MNSIQSRVLDTLLATDAYKLDHRRQYPEGTEYVYSNLTARGTRVPGVNDTVFFGLQAYLDELTQRWSEFFSLDSDELGEVLDEYSSFVTALLGPNDIGVEHFRELHALGHLPIRVRAVREGTLVPLRVPYLTIENTNPRFFWMTNYFETELSAELWQPITSATIAWDNHQLLSLRAAISGSPEAVKFQGHDFSYRGMAGTHAAAASGAGHLISFAGTDSLPSIRFIEHHYPGNGDELIGASVPACYDDKTEILSASGFKLFRNLEDGERVAQYHPDGTVTFVVPTKRFDDPFQGHMIAFTSGTRNRINAVVTPNHRMVAIAQSGSVELVEAASFKGRNKKIPLAGEAVGGKVNTLSALDRLEIAFQADGSYAARAHRYSGARTGTLPLRFTIKKERKKERLRSILSELEWEYTETHQANRSGYSHFWIRCPESIHLHKTFDWIPYGDITSEWARDFVEEVSYWDGTRHRGSMQFSSVLPENVEAVQTVATLAGYRTHTSEYKDKRSTRQRQYTVSVSYAENTASGAGISTQTVPYDGRVYCVSVPTKMLVVRREGRVMVCGNTEHSVMCAGGQDGELKTFERLLDLYPSGILSVVSDTWDLWKVLTEYLPARAGEIMMRPGRLVIRPDSGDPERILCGDPDAPEGSPAREGVVKLLAKTFGTTTNDKGYRDLNPCVGAIYGDSITRERADAITRNLMRQGYSSTCVVFGFGSYTYQYQTRDTFKMAVKATWVQVNGAGRDIQKDPVTDDGSKKSATGRLAVRRMMDGRHYLVEHATPEQEEDQELELVYENGELLRRQSFADVRATLVCESGIKGRREKVVLR